MQCDFLDWSGGVFGSYYCRKDEKYIDKCTVNTYCDNSLRYRDCPIYSKSSGPDCYLTTAMCNILGYEDNCQTLEILRGFRDNYMKQTEECLPLLEDYDLVGPKVCEKMEKDENKFKVANIMLLEYITPAIKAIKEEYNDDAIEIYKEMTLNLMKHYGFDTSMLACEKENSVSKTRKKVQK